MLYYTKTSHFLKIYESVKKRFQRGETKILSPVTLYNDVTSCQKSEETNDAFSSKC